MQKLSKKSGLSLIEVLCSISILSILFAAITDIEINNLRLRAYNQEVMNYTTVLEALKEEMLSNYTYENIRQLYNQNKRFITKDKLTLDTLKSADLEQIFVETNDYGNSYVKLNVIEDEVLKIQLELHIKLKDKEDIIECDFLKGNYL